MPESSTPPQTRFMSASVLCVWVCVCVTRKLLLVLAETQRAFVSYCVFFNNVLLYSSMKILSVFLKEQVSSSRHHSGENTLDGGAPNVKHEEPI